MTSEISPPDSLCLLRLSALGDVCNTVPLVRALQRSWPGTSITWIIGKPEHQMLRGLPGVEFIVFDKRAGLAAFRHVRRELAGRRFDMLLHTQVSFRSNLLATQIKARRRIGFDRLRSRECHGLVINERIATVPMQHQALAFLEFARYLDLSIRNVDRRLPSDESDRAFAIQQQPEAGHSVIISPSSSHPARNWSVAGYAEIADWIIEKHERPVILIGGPSDRETQLAADIESRMRHAPINLVGQDTLKQAVAMIDRAACLITPDAGPAHIGAAMGTPVVGLYAVTWSRRSGPLGSLEHCVDCFPEAARMYEKREPEAVRWGHQLKRPGVMDLITPDMVKQKLEVVLKPK